MPKYQILLTKTATKQLNKLPNSVSAVIIDTINVLADNPRPPGCKKLKGRDGYRIRKGNYRIIYSITDSILTIDVIAIGDRKDIYD